VSMGERIDECLRCRCGVRDTDVVVVLEIVRTAWQRGQHAWLTNLEYRLQMWVVEKITLGQDHTLGQEGGEVGQGTVMEGGAWHAGQLRM
jgi:hypothetical protein